MDSDDSTSTMPRLPAAMLALYSMLLVRVLVFKQMPTIRIGSLRLNLAGADGNHPPNLRPLRTILSYMNGDKGLIIGGINIVGNIALLVPVGVLWALIDGHASWRRRLTLATLAGVSIELVQNVLQVGIFDVDDVILNALGVMVGGWLRSLGRGAGLRHGQHGRTVI